jgi:hypothetical protein
MTTNFPLADSVIPAFQYVSVPSEHVPAVYRLLADLAAVAPSPEPELTTGSGRYVFTDEILKEISVGRYTTTSAITEIMDILAKRPGDWFDRDALVAATGRTSGQLGVVWSKFSGYLESRYGTTNWPFRGVGGRNLTPPRDPKVWYSMTAAEAEQWLRVRAN